MTEFYMGIDIGSPAGDQTAYYVAGENDDDRRGDFSPPPDFTIGDVVSLLIGGPDMVVISTCDCGTVEVAWADSDGDVCIDVFPEEALISHE